MSVWTTKWVRHFIDTRFGMEYCRERVRQLLHELGFRLRWLRHRHLKAQPEEQAALKGELEALLEDWPAEWELMFVDEATVRRHLTLTAPWGWWTKSRRSRREMTIPRSMSMGLSPR